MMFVNSLLSAADTGRMELFYHALSISGKGLLGIFIVTFIIILMVLVLNKITSKKTKNE